MKDAMLTNLKAGIMEGRTAPQPAKSPRFTRYIVAEAFYSGVSVEKVMWSNAIFLLLQ
jgi:hypothetical protein